MSAVVVTGASSFVGCHLARTFAEAGWDVVATHSRPRDRYLGIQAERLAWVERTSAKLRRLDLRDHTVSAAIVNEIAPVLWVQHAGHAANYGSPEYDAKLGEAVNVAPLAPLYGALAKRRCSVIITGSSMEYAPTDRANREDDGCEPATPYGQSKLAQTRAAESLARQYAVPTRVARLYIPFGALDSPNKLIPMVGEALRTGRPIALSPCEQKRDFVAVDDVARGYLALAADMSRTTFDIFNLCTGKALALKTLLLALAATAGRDAGLLRFGAVPMRPGEPLVSYGDNTKAARLLDWRPRAPEAALAELVVSVV